ncbi:polyamine transporter PUT1-like isoform X2 [Wolffia australiana]
MLPRKRTAFGDNANEDDRLAGSTAILRVASSMAGDSKYSVLPENDGTAAAEKDDDAGSFRKVSVLPLVFLIFYEVSGGPFGVEDSVRAAGPLLALLGFLLFPLVWSVPEALITAELGTLFPENGGYVVWVSAALGPFWGFQQGWLKWLSGVIDNALYPVLFLDYLQSSVPSVAAGAPRSVSALLLTAALTLLNYRGLVVVGRAAVLLGAFSLLPFLAMAALAAPRLDPARWLGPPPSPPDWGLYLNTLFWNLNYWDSVSTLAGEVHNPRKTLPRALLYALLLVVLAYLVPLLAATGAVAADRADWTDGFFAVAARALGGPALGAWVQAAAAVSNAGMFLAEMSSDSFQLLGMAERGMLPEVFARRSKYGTPAAGILFSAAGVAVLSWLSFQEIVAAENFLYCVGMVMEFVAFVRLRVRRVGEGGGGFRVPLGTGGCVAMLAPPTALIGVVLALSTFKVLAVSLVAVGVGLLLHPLLELARNRRWLRFLPASDLAF